MDEKLTAEEAKKLANDRMTGSAIVIVDGIVIYDGWAELHGGPSKVGMTEEEALRKPKWLRSKS